MEEEPSMCGELNTRMWLPWLSLRLRLAGIRNDLEDLGTVIALRLGPKVDFELRHYVAGRYVAVAHAKTSSQLLEAASLVSKVLRQLKIQHRFEIDEDETLHDGLRYDWPSEKARN
jgi:hypothetical protein